MKEQRFTHPGRRVLSLLLSILMLCSVLPLQLWAAEAQAVRQGEQPASLMTEDGEIPLDEDWGEVYPYGTFAFGSYQADLGEPGALTPEGEALPGTQLLPVYRIGGTRGRVTAKITYAPAITTDESGAVPVYDYAASGRSDLLIEVENTNPLAWTQDIGLPQAEREMQPAPGVSVCAETDADGRLTLSLRGAEEASGWRWQYRGAAGGWKDVEGGTEAVLTLTTDDYSALGITGWDGLDFRCILTVDDFLLCTVSLDGEVFTPYTGALDAAPEAAQTASAEETGYTAIEFADDYDIYEFELTFAEGETVKYIRVSALDDETAELPELGLFTIVGCEGGECSDLCNTLTLMVSDNDEGDPSELGFTVSAVTVDRAEGVAYASVRRTGGMSYNVTVDYETADGTAKAGTDYAAKSGSLAFAGSIDEIRIPIELISNEETGDKTFSLKLSNLKGGGTDGLCTLTNDTVTFTLTGEAPQGETGQNLATVLSGHNGTEAADRVSVGEDALVPEDTAQRADVRMAQSDPVEAEFVSAGDSATRSHVVNNAFKFTRGSSYPDAYWHDWEIVCGGSVFASDVSDSVEYSGLWKSEVRSGKEGYEQYVDGNTGGVDKNGNEVHCRITTERTGSSAVLAHYLEIASNYTGGVELEIEGAGRLYDAAELILYLESVGTKKMSKNSRYLQPSVIMNCTPYDEIHTTVPYSSVKFQVKGKDKLEHWLMSNGFTANPKYWNLSNPRSSGDYSAEWPDSAFLDTFELTWDSQLRLAVVFEVYKQWSMSFLDNYERMQGEEETVVDIPVFRLQRRVMPKTNSIPIVIYTANDADEAGKNGWTKLADNSVLYNSLKPTLRLVEHAGGVTESGQLYAGSTFTVDTSAIASSFLIPDEGLFLTKKGTSTRVGTVTRNSNTLWTIKMDWEGMTEADLNAEYQINILLDRYQKIEIDLAPSVVKDANGNLTSSNVTAAFNKFIQNPAAIRCSKLALTNFVPTAAANGMYYGQTDTTGLTKSYYSIKSGTDATYVTRNFANIQAVTFNQDPEDVILYNGRAYAGNATIQLTEADLAASTVHFTYYAKDFLDAGSQLAVNVDHVELYYDGDGDGKISGTLTSAGTFEPAAPDELISTKMYGDYPESRFKPVVIETRDSSGNVTGRTVHQYYMKVFFTLRPRSFRVPVGASVNDKSQILPAFASALTDDAERAALTEEQRSYRYLRGANTDGHPMYGEAASAISYVDIALGGDLSELLYESVTTAVKDKNGKITGANTTETYTWNPEFVGSLLVPFTNPAPVIDNNNATGGAVPMAGKNIALNEATGAFDYDDESLAAMNAFLGAMTGRSTFVIGIQPQKSALNAIKSMSQICPETITVGSVATTPNGDGVMNQTSGGTPGDSGGSAPGDDAGYPEFGADLGTELPNLELELGDYATLIMDGYQVGFAIGIPIYKYEDTNYSGSEHTKTNTDGTTYHTETDENGKKTETTTSKDKKTVTTTTTEPDNADPKKATKRTVTQVVEVEDDKGKKTYKTVVEQQEKKTDPKTKKETWETTDKKTTDTAPPAPSQAPQTQKKTAGENFKEGFKEANGQMQTLMDFVSACKSKNFDTLKDFFSGSFEDDSLKNAKNGNCTSTKVEVSFTVQISIMFEYNPIDNCHYFKSAGLSASLGIELSVQHRFSAFPLAYVYVKLGIEVEVAVSLSCIRNPKLGAEITSFRQGSLSGLANGKPVVFALNMTKQKVAGLNGKKEDQKIRGFHIDLLGTVYMEIYDNAKLNGRPVDAGTLSGDGTEKEVLLKDYNDTVYIKLTPMRGQVVADKLRPVIGASSKVVFDGLNITPSISLEAGVGIGIELLKFEIFVKTSIAITMTMGGYLEETDSYEGFYISSFEWGLCVGFNVTALFFNYSMDAIGISVEGEQHGTGGYFSWEISASAVNGDKVLWTKETYTAADGKSLPDEPEPPEDNNIGPADTEFGYVYGGYPNGSTYYVPPVITVPADGFPDNCGWELKENVKAWEWDGGEFKGEIPQDGDVCKATRDRVYVEIPVPAGSGEILVYFDGKIDISCSPTGYRKDGVKSSPAKIPVGDSAATVRLTLSKDTLLDRWAVVSEDEDDANKSIRPAAGTRSAQQGSAGLIHVSGPADVSGSQRITRAGEEADTRAIRPNGTPDFELSGYNTAGDAKKLVDGLANGYDYKLFQANGENYILYPLMLSTPETPEGSAQLVMSRIVMTGDLSVISGLEHPTDPDAAVPYLKVDNDGYGDLDYGVAVDGKTVTVVWTAYNSAPAASATESAKHVVVKQASLTLGTDTVFTEPQLLTAGVGSFRFLPAAAAGAAVWAEQSGDGSANNEKLAAYLIASNEGLTQAMLDAKNTNNAMLANAIYRWTLQSDLNTIYGRSSRLVASTGAAVTLNGENLENIELGTLGGRTLALYTTTQSAYFDASADTPVTVEPEDFDRNTELGTIRRLYLRELRGESWGEALLLETVIDFDACTDDNLESKTLQDGVYVGGSLQAAQADPYFSNLRFLRADLDGAGAAETLLLFEMGGNSYLLREADAEALLSGGVANVLPIFEQTTGTDVSIGSDGENLAIVYTAAVSNSLSNAIYTAWWDRNADGWGSPTLLAMRNLQIYEDGVRFDMKPEALEQAYLGKANTPAGNTGSMSKLYFSDLQMATRTFRKDDGTENKQLLVLTMGSLQELQERSYTGNGGKQITSVVPKGAAKLGFYAIAFGVGDQALGEGRLSLANYDFSQGSKLVGGLSFVNTGTTAIRASEANPLTVRLLVDTGAESQKLATWQLTESIRSGASVNLSFQSLELTKTLPVGSSFWLDVTEDEYFGENAFSAKLEDLLTVEQRPELSISGFTAELDEIQGSTAYLNITATVLNNGNTEATGVYLQFAYGTGGKDTNGLPEYKPVNITGSDLSCSNQADIPSRQAVVENYNDGVYRLRGEDGTTLLPGKYRTVTGRLAVPTSCFVTRKEFSGLHLRAEVYSNFDSPDYDSGLYSSDHNEYNSTNNRSEQTLKHATVFDVPAHITTALGTTLTLPVSYEATSASSELVLTEISDGTEGWEPRMGICYYDPDNRVIIAAPNEKAQAMLEAGQKPTGILQLKDNSTNTIAAIAYTVGAMAEGVNIYRDDASFTFYDANGSKTNLTASASENPGWFFLDKGVEVGWTGGSAGEIPMNRDLSLANQDNASLKFKTVADTLTIYFMGQIRVKSSVFGTEQTFTSSPAVLNFGNSAGVQHEITITAAQNTRIDRYVATYQTNTVPEADPDAPQVLWNRSFPETASVRKGSSVPMTCYILDGSGLSAVRFNGEELSETTTPKLVKLDDCLWYFDYSFTANDAFSVRAIDSAGNASGGRFNVDWFNDVLTTGAISDAPGLLRGQLSFVSSSGAAVNPQTGTLTEAPYLKSAYAPAANETSSAYLFEGGVFPSSALGKSTEERWLAGWNGYYQVRVDREDGTWARAIISLKNLDLSTPANVLYLEGDGTPGVPYQIGSLADWKELQRYVSSGGSTAGLSFRQTADVELTPDDSIGSNSNRFRGSYDGDGHTLTMNAASAPSDCSPFSCVEDAAFRNLHLAGTVTTSAQLAAGLCANAHGSCTIVNCRSSVTIISDLSGEGTHGGFIGIAGSDSEIRFTGCVFDGAFYGENTTLCGGFVGSALGTLSLKDCLFAPTAAEFTSSQNFFGEGSGASCTMENCDYLGTAFNSQGTRGWAVLPGTDVKLTFPGGTIYDVAGIESYPAGMLYGQTCYAGVGESVTVRPSYTGSAPDDAESFFVASGGTFTETTAGYTLVLPAKDVTVNVGTHEWKPPTYVWSEDNSSVTATRVCKFNPNHTETETVNTTSEVTTQPTCTEKGKTTYTAEFTNPAFSKQTKTLENIDALGHDWGKVTYTWSTDYKTCTAQRICKRDASHVETETVNTTSRVSTQPTCTAMGKTTYTAVFTNTAFQTQKKTATDIPALGHDWNNPTYTWASNGKTCTAERICKRDASHVETETVNTTSEVTTQPTCTAKGKTTYTAVFTNTAFETQTKTLTNVAAIGHNYELTGWNWMGYTAATATFNCKNDASHVQTVNATITSVRTEPTAELNGSVVYTAKVTFEGTEYTDTATEILPALGHAYVLSGWNWTGYTAATATFRDTNGGADLTVDALISQVRTEPTCETSGQIVYTATVTLNGETYTNSKTDTLPALGHDWGNPTYTWASNGKTCTAERICKRDANHVETETVNTTSEVTTQPTCTEKGKTTYTAAFTNTAFETQTKTLTNVAALGHAWGTPSYLWAADGSSVTATRTCGNDANHVETETVNTTSEVTTQPTCTAKGKTTYTAAFTNTAFETQTKTLTNVAALGHDWDNPTYTWASNGKTCTAERICKRDANHVETETVNTTSEVTTQPTCTAKGKTTYTAAFTNTAFETQTKTLTDVAALGHDLVHHDAQAPTCTEIGWEAYDACSRCDYTTYVEKAALGHDLVHHDAQAPTCTEIGWEAYDACSRCDYTTYVEKAALGHDWNAPTYEWAEDNSTVTATRVCKNNAEHTETETVAPNAEVTKEATFDEEGEITYTATFENPAFETQTKAVATPKLEKPDDGLPCDGGDTCPGMIFTDMPAKEHWAHDAIDWAIVHGITAGTSATTFSPNAGCTRAQVVTFLWRAAGAPEPTGGNNPFKDIEEGTWYYEAVLWASETGVTAGTSATTFSPNATCTRAQIVTFIWRYEKSPEVETGQNPFTDVPAGAYYEKAVLWASETGVTAGTSATTFSPNATCTRAQIVTFLYRDMTEE